MINTCLLAFDVYPEDDPRDGARLVRLTADDGSGQDGFLSGTEPHKVLRGFGTGRIVLHTLHPAVVAGHMAAGNYVRVVDITDPEDERVVFGFWLREAEETVISRDEEGGEIRSFGGGGTLEYVTRGTLPTEAASPFAGPNDIVDGEWRFGDDTYGGVLRRSILEANLKSPPDFPDIFFTVSGMSIIGDAITWDDVEDSNGAAWSHFDGEYRPGAIGAGIGELLGEITGKGVDALMDPDLFVLSAYLAGTAGTDRSGDAFASDVVRFERGTAGVGGVPGSGNIVDELRRTIHHGSYASHVLVVGDDGVTTVEVVDPDWSPGDPVYRATLYLSTTVDETVMTDAGTESIRLRKLQQDTPTFTHIPGNDPEAGLYRAGVHYDVGDTVRLHTGTGEHDYNEADFEVAGIRWVMNDTGDFDPKIELGAQFRDTRSTASSRSSGGGGGGGGVRLCQALTPGGETSVRLYPSTHESGDADTSESQAGPSLTGGDRDGGWEGLGLGVYHYMYDDPANSTSSSQNTWTAVNAAAGQYMVDGLVHILDGDLLACIQAGGTVRGQFLARSRYGIGVSEAAQDNYSAWGIRVYRPGSGFVQTLLSVQAGGSSKFPAAATLQNRLWSATIPAYPGAQSGDFIVVEIGTDHVGPTSGATGVSILYEDTAATDLPEDELETEGRNSWMEFRSIASAAGSGNHPDLVGTETSVARCDHRHHVIRDRAPTSADDETQGYPVGTFWVLVDDVETPTQVLATYLLVDATEGAAVWVLQAGTGSGGEPGESLGPIVSEEDGDPSVAAPTEIRFSNGTVTDNGDGTVSVSNAHLVHSHEAPTPGFHGVLVRRTTDFTTTNSNDSIPDFDTEEYDTDGLWEGVTNPERITIPASWDGLVAIFHARGGWSGHTGTYVEMKLYRNGTGSEDNLIAVTQHATNTASPFQELVSPPISVAEGDYFTITFRTPSNQTLIDYFGASVLFGAYLVGSGGGGEVTEADVRDAGRWEVVVSGTAPPVAVTNEAEDDWLYSWVSEA